jgi:hypothetical protein
MIIAFPTVPSNPANEKEKRPKKKKTRPYCKPVFPQSSHPPKQYSIQITDVLN